MEHAESLKGRIGVTFFPPALDGEAGRIVELLHGMETLHGVPREQLEWLVRESELISVDPGLWNHPGDVFDYLLVMLEGRLEAYVMQNGQRKSQMTAGPGSMTGLIPFSRMKASPVFTEAVGPVKTLGLHRSKFPKLIATNYELTEVLVHSMIDRVRLFTSNHFQNEKLMSLGKLSAGLAHELNNPAAAIVRSASDLKETIGSLSSNLEAFSVIDLTPAELGCLAPILEKATKVSATRMPLLERKRRENELTDWLEDKKVAIDCAETFADFGLATEDLEGIRKTVSERAFLPLVTWLANSLQAEKAVHEIETSARRISELVQSVKSYTRMDQVQDMQEVQINEGIRNTITMLEYKARRNSVTMNEELEKNLPVILGFPGELNQIWTNIIDNAVDAMKEGGELTLRTYSEAGNVLFSATDNGPGIPAENLERIFDPFFTTKDVGEGTGVGLDLVQKVVTLHKGKIDVTSRPGRTEFLVAFPSVASSA